MQKTLTLNKPLGKTPLEVLEEYKNKQPEYADIKMAYAGRLDPMAEGKLLVLVGEECKKRDKYLNLDKEYEFEVLLGVSSDTSDILGITDFSTITKPERVSVAGLDFWTRLDHVIKNLQGKQNFPYPAFSSKTVEGKPLFLWALENKLHEIQIPTKEAEVYSLRHIETTLIKSSDLHTQIQTKIDRITPVVVESKQLGQDFRRKEVLKTWENNLNLEEIQVIHNQFDTINI